MVNIKLFDSLEFEKDGKPVLEGLLNTRKTKQFLAYLILNKDRSVTQKELFELLWSGVDNHGVMSKVSRSACMMVMRLS